MDVVCFTRVFLFFLFKQKTAYELRISDWSSDVCSSDLPNQAQPTRNRGFRLPITARVSPLKFDGVGGVRAGRWCVYGSLLVSRLTKPVDTGRRAPSRLSAVVAWGPRKDAAIVEAIGGGPARNGLGWALTGGADADVMLSAVTGGGGAEGGGVGGGGV